MIKVINKGDFIQAFTDYNRKEQFSYDALEILFEYFEEYEESTGQPVQLDVIAICCEFVEMDIQEIIEQYDTGAPSAIAHSELDEENEEEVTEFLVEYLGYRTQVAGCTEDGIVFAGF